MKRSRASSLVLVVVVMAGIIIVVFGASRLTLVQYNQSNRDEDNIFALSAAKAGIEDGLLRFRYNRDAETGSTATGTKVARYNLTTGVSAGEVDENSKSSFGLNEQYYDMKLNFRGGQIGTFRDDTTYTVTKDDTLELTGFPVWTDKYYLRYRFDFVGTGNECDNALVQIQQVQETSDSQQPIIYEQVTVKKLPATLTVDSKDLGANMFIRTNPGNSPQLTTSSIRLRPYGCSVKYSLTTSKTENGDGQGGNKGPNFDNFKSTITSTGYYGAAKRTLIAEIDRTSGQLLSIYDFNIYSGTGDIKP